MMLSRTAPLTFAAACAWAAAVALTGGCASAPPAAATGTLDGLAPPGAALRIRLTPPRDVASRRGARDTVVLRAAATLLGRVRDTAGDTVWLAVSEVRTARGDLLRPAGAVVTLVRGEGTEVEVLSRDPGRVQLITLLIPVALFIAGWLYVCASLCGEST